MWERHVCESAIQYDVGCGPTVRTTSVSLLAVYYHVLFVSMFEFLLSLMHDSFISMFDSLVSLMFDS